MVYKNLRLSCLLIGCHFHELTITTSHELTLKTLQLLHFLGEAIMIFTKRQESRVRDSCIQINHKIISLIISNEISVYFKTLSN